MDLFLKALSGAAVVLLIHFAATSKNYHLAGLIPLFPTFSLISHYMIGKDHAVSDLSETILFGICSLIPLLVYLITLYFLINKFSLFTSLFTSTVSWGIVAILLLASWNSIKEIGKAENIAAISPSPLIHERSEEEPSNLLVTLDPPRKTSDASQMI